MESAMGSEINISEFAEKHEIGYANKVDDVIYFDVNNAIKLVDACLNDGVGILGIEGFIFNDGISPQLEWIADFSEFHETSSFDSFVKKSCVNSRKFLGMIGAEKILFEFVLSFHP